MCMSVFEFWDNFFHSVAGHRVVSGSSVFFGSSRSLIDSRSMEVVDFHGRTGPHGTSAVRVLILLRIRCAEFIFLGVLFQRYAKGQPNSFMIHIHTAQRTSDLAAAASTSSSRGRRGLGWYNRAHPTFTRF